MPSLFGPADQECGPTGFRWRLAGPPGPPLVVALMLAEAVRALVFRAAERHRLMPLPDAFHGGNGGAHCHAHWLVEDADADGLADHVLLFAATGLPPPLLPVLAAGGELVLRLAGGRRLPACGCWRLTPEWMGRGGPPYLLAAARAWRSVTPFVTPQWTRRAHTARPGRDIAAQIRRELALRALPPPELLTLLPGPAAAEWIGRGARGASRHRAPPGDALAAHVALRFAVPLPGPLALGFGAHFGLGLFAALDTPAGQEADTQ